MRVVVGWALLLMVGTPSPGHFGDSGILSLTQDSNGALRQKVLERFQDIDANQKGVFNEDITDLIAPFFPPGDTLEQTGKTIAQEKIGRLRRFKGIMEPGDGAMFVTDFNLMTATFSQVYVVIDLSFVENAEGKMVVRKSRAFLRSSNM